jgi:hypothetical protein
MVVTRVVVDSVGVNPGNVIEVAMEDLTEKDQNDLVLELQREIQEVMAERRNKKGACF